MSPRTRLRVRHRVYYGWVLVVTLGITEAISWGVLYYAFAVLIQPMGEELGWTLGELSGAFSLALLLRRRPEDVGLTIDGEPVAVATSGAPAVRRSPGLPVGEALRTRSFRRLVLAFCLSAAISTAVRVHLVPYLIGRGFDAASAAAFTGTIGAMQVLGRIVLGALSHRVSIRAAAVAAFGLQALGLLVLVAARDTLGVMAFVAVFGASFGAVTLVRPAFVASLYGRGQYASIAGVLAFATTLAQAAAPFGAGVAHDWLGSYDPLLWAFAVLSVIAALALLPVRQSSAWSRENPG